MQKKEPGSVENNEQANYNPTARNFDQEDVTGPSKPINEVNQEETDAPKESSGRETTAKENTEANEGNEPARESNWAPPEESGRNEQNRNEDLPNAPAD